MSTDGLESAFTSPPLFVSSLRVYIKPQSRKEIETVIVNAGTIKREIRRMISPGGRHQERFYPPLEIPLDTKFFVSIHCRKDRDGITVSLDPKADLSAANEEYGKQVYCKTENDVEVAVGIQSLPPTVDEIVESCPRFRILIIGKSGVGKSSLINKVFGASQVHVSDTTRGKATIDREYIASDNDRFVVHDSCGFEAGDRDNLYIAQRFITGRRCMRDIKDQLHAIWLCLEVPFAGGRVLETGVEEFLRERDRILGSVPLVVVFTKLDSLVNTWRFEALRAGQHLDDATLQHRMRQTLEQHCFGPIRTALGNNDVPSVAVSTEDDYGGSLIELVEKTTNNVKKHITNEAAYYIATMAQRVNIALKIEATIAFGEKRYWNKLRESPNFRGHTLKACLDVLHEDIVLAWQIKDPQRSLYGEGLKEALLKTPDKGTRRPRQSGGSIFAALIATIGSAKITGPVSLTEAVTGIFHKLAHSRYKASPETVRQLMAYIIDLTCVMQILSLLIAVCGGEASAAAVSVARNAYEQTYRPNVHAEITEFFAQPSSVSGRRDDALDKIKELICKYRIPNEDFVKLRGELQSAGPL